MGIAQGKRKRDPFSGAVNARQLEVFRREELPYLKERLSMDSKPSVCLLTPFNGQREALRRLLEETFGDRAVAASRSMAGETRAANRSPAEGAKGTTCSPTACRP